MIFEQENKIKFLLSFLAHALIGVMVATSLAFVQGASRGPPEALEDVRFRPFYRGE